MNSLIPLLLITLSLVIVTRAKSHNHCNDECLTKTYCLSKDGSGTCSRQNLVNATWSVVLRPGMNDLIGLTLVGYGIGVNDEITISTTFIKPKSRSDNSLTDLIPQTNYTCIKSSLGSSSSEVKTIGKSIITFSTGSSSYSDNLLTCTWFFGRKDEIYPLYQESDVDLVTQSNYQLSLQHGAIETTVATDTSQLPIYRMQFLKCCYKVHGNDDYIIVANQTKDNSYLVRTLDKSADALIITLTDSNGISLIFTCNFETNSVQAIIASKTDRVFISDQIYRSYASNGLCKWSHPLELIDFPSPYDTTNGVFDLQLSADGKIVYEERGFKLRNGTSNLFSGSTTLTRILFTLFLNWFIWS